MEGNVKLQAEKPVNNNVKIMQLTKIYDEVIIFLKKMENFESEWYIINAVERAKNIAYDLFKTKNHT
ncbi:MAG: DUF1122 family protein [Thermoprotei archaeon]|jgi:hypothetical protein